LLIKELTEGNYMLSLTENYGFLRKKRDDFQCTQQIPSISKITNTYWNLFWYLNFWLSVQKNSSKN